MNDKRKTHDRLLELTALSGECPHRQMARIYSESYKEKKASALRTSGLIKNYSRDGLRSIRLTNKGRKYLLEKYPDRFASSIVDSKHIKPYLANRLRMHKLCGTLISMENAGVLVYDDEKTPLFSQGTGLLTAPGAMKTPAFYSSREVKSEETLDAERMKILSARFMGILFTNSSVYLCYNTGNSLLKWEFRIEQRAKSLIYALSRELFPGKYGEEDIKGIMIGDSCDVALQFLTEPQKRKGSFNAFYLDGVFSHFHFIPADDNGDALLALLCSERQKAILYKSLSSQFYPPDKNITIENDGFDGNGNPVLFAFDFDMKRIMNYLDGLEFSHFSSGSIICFDFQAQVLREKCSGKAEILSAKFEDAKILIREAI